MAHTQDTRTVGWGRFAGFVHGRELWIGWLVCTAAVVWEEHWTWGQARRCKQPICPWCIERAKKRTRVAVAFRRQGERGWRLLEGGTRFARRLDEAIGADHWYGAVLRFSRDGDSANASWNVEYDGRATWSNPKRPPVPLGLIRDLVEPV